jgi:hypothetical protein
MDPIITVSIANNNWDETLALIDVPTQNHIREAVTMHFIDNGANTPLQFIGQLIMSFFTDDGAYLNETTFKILLRRFKGCNLQDDDVQLHIRRTLFALIDYTNVRFTLQLTSHNIFVDTFMEFNSYLNGIDVSAG